MIGRAVSRVALVGPAVRGWRRPGVLGAEATAAPLPSAVNSLALIVAKVGAMGLGGLFWLLAARIASPTEVGLAAGAVSAMMLCTQVAILGFGSAVILHMRSNQERLSALLNSALVLVVGASAALSVGFIAIAGAVLGQLDVVAHSVVFAVLFVVAGVCGTVGILLDQTNTALRRGDQALVRNVAFGAVTLVGLVVMALLSTTVSATGLFVPWAVGGALATVIGLRQLRRSVQGYRPRASIDLPLGRRLVRSALPNYVLTLADRAPALVLPIIITELLSPGANATWYGVWMMAFVVYTIPVQIGLTVFSEIARDPASEARAVRRGVRTSLAFALPLAGVVALGAQPLLGLLGEHYAAGGVTPLRILVLGLVPITFVQAYFASARARGRLREATAVAVSSALVSVAAVAAVAAATGGLTAIALAWFAAQVPTALWSAWRLRATATGRAITATKGGTMSTAGATVTGDTPAPGAVDPAGEAVHPPGRPGGPGLADRAGVLVPWLLPLAALVIAWVALRGADASGITDLGLVSVLPIGYYLALAVLAAGFVLALRGRERTPLLVLQMVAAIVLLYCVVLPFEQEPSFNVVYRHAGIIDHLLTGGPLDASIDAYFNWPGFFILGEFVVDLTGLHGALPMASYAPLVFNLLALPALVVIAKAATSDWRTAWIGVWVFYLTNWVGQDYFSPQAYAYVLYLTLAVAMLTTLSARVDAPQRWWRRSVAARVRSVGRAVGAAAEPQEVPGPAVTGRERGGVVLACTLLFAAMVAGHQLTPFASLLLVLTLVVARRTSARLLPLIGSLLLVTWLGFMAADYLRGSGRALLSDAVSLGTTVSANVGERVNGSSEHLAIVFVRLGVTGVLWLLAAVGIVRMLRHGRPAPSHALLAFVPLVLVPLQPYGGEVLLRAYLFALPFIAVLVAWALFPALGAAWTWRRSAGLLVVSCLLMGAFMFTRYGNERIALFTSAERAATTYVYAHASRGDVVAAASSNVAWQDVGYTDYDYQQLSRLADPAPAGETPVQLADRIAGNLQNRSRGAAAYLLITRSQLDYEEMTGSLPWGSVRALEQGAQQSSRFHLLYDNPDAMVFEVRKAP
ncbi:MAG: Membrane protein involved in the export of O-antigen and teichoic acid [Modestobacter sp.]|nr:Membrane protein involved in the export of O-antigen and teichoic acid [Modestobacter sp.]